MQLCSAVSIHLLKLHRAIYYHIYHKWNNQKYVYQAGAKMVSKKCLTCFLPRNQICLGNESPHQQPKGKCRRAGATFQMNLAFFTTFQTHNVCPPTWLLRWKNLNRRSLATIKAQTKWFVLLMMLQPMRPGQLQAVSQSLRLNHLEMKMEKSLYVRKSMTNSFPRFCLFCDVLIALNAWLQQSQGGNIYVLKCPQINYV